MHFTVDRIYIYTTNVDVMHAEITWQIFTYLHVLCICFLISLVVRQLLSPAFSTFDQSCYRSPS